MNTNEINNSPQDAYNIVPDNSPCAFKNIIIDDHTNELENITNADPQENVDMDSRESTDTIPQENAATIPQESTNTDPQESTNTDPQESTNADPQNESTTSIRKVPIMYINLDRSTDRNLHMIESLTFLKTDFYRIQGIDMNSMPRKDYQTGSCQDMKYHIKPMMQCRPRQKEIAIMLSHLKAINAVIKNDFDNAIIMEDDMSFQYVDGWNETINKIINDAPNGWNIIKLHLSDKNGITKNIELCKKNIMYKKLDNCMEDLQSAGCYIINKKAAKLLIEKYLIDDTYTFPKDNEYCVCECVVFSISPVYIYTLPLLCALEKNITCSGTVNPADAQSNTIIHNYWKNIKISNNVPCGQSKNKLPNRFLKKTVDPNKNTTIDSSQIISQIVPKNITHNTTQIVPKNTITKITQTLPQNTMQNAQQILTKNEPKNITHKFTLHNLSKMKK